MDSVVEGSPRNYVVKTASAAVRAVGKLRDRYALGDGSGYGSGLLETCINPARWWWDVEGLHTKYCFTSHPSPLTTHDEL